MQERITNDDFWLYDLPEATHNAIQSENCSLGLIETVIWQ